MKLLTRQSLPVMILSKMTEKDLLNELEFTRYADKLLTEINKISERIYGQTLTHKERVKLAIKLMESRA